MPSAGKAWTAERALLMTEHLAARAALLEQVLAEDYGFWIPPGDSAWEALALYVEIPTSAADIVAVFGEAEDGRRRARLLADLVALRMLLRYAQVA